MKRRNHWVLFAILLLALINLSPSKQSTLIRNEGDTIPESMSLPNPKEVQEPGHFRVAVQMNEGEFLRLQQMNDEYMNQTADQVDLVNIPLGEQSHLTLLQQFELGDSPDVLLLPNDWIRKFASSGYLMPAERYYSSPLTGEVLGALLAQNEWNGYIWGVPFDVDPYVFAYNPDLIQELGFDQPPKSVDDWERLLSAFKKQSQIPNLLAVDQTEPYAALSLLWQFGGNTATGSPSIFEITEGMQRGIRFLEEIRPYLLRYHVEAQPSPNVWKRMYDGEVVICLVRASDIKNGQHPRMKIFMPEPGNTGKAMWNYGRSFVVSSKSSNAEAAGNWIMEMTVASKQREWYEITGHMPVLKSLYFDFEKNKIPAWVPASLVGSKSDALPVSSILPEQIEQFSRLSIEFMNGHIGPEQYMKEISQIGDEK
ncbi:ABC transporter substrate-binding protein [Paenibacillus lentus]|uniref:Extracellular solute-binding protein n=1 Tax=Paenibacillus lentus TaxID=1338368 RepID=A0A3S8RW02_9BACL|nr:extracellular solute-binding protein [Paenibacillus lentus]AZK46867.1 extracellular solute-binding protein [Paenibacillus lentus]